MLSAIELAESPSTTLVRQEDARLLLQALRMIPLDAQTLIELWFWEDLSGAQIGAILGIPEATVRSRLRRAIQRLREQVEAMTGVAPEDHDLQRRAGELRAAVDGEN